MNKPLIEILKDLSAIVVGAAAVLYVFGFTVHLAYFRLLGVEMVGQPLDYMRLAADYGASIIGALLQLVYRLEYYLPKLMQWPMSLATVSCLLIILLLILLHLPMRGLRSYLARRRLFKQRLPLRRALWHALNILIIICWGVILDTELNIAKVRDVLQPVDAADIQQMQGQPVNLSGADWQGADSVELRSKNVARVYEKHIQSGKGNPGFHGWNNWFNPVTRPYTSDERNATYLALLFINIVSLVAVIHQLISLKWRSEVLTSPPEANQSRSRLALVMLSLVLCSQLLLFPFVYATLGRYFTYPVVTLKINSEANSVTKTAETPSAQATPSLLDPSWTHGVYLIAQTDSEVVVYDRLNFFQIKHLPRARVLAINQLFNASPFDSCSEQEDEFIPCEVLWLPEAKPILDF